MDPHFQTEPYLFGVGALTKADNKVFHKRGAMSVAWRSYRVAMMLTCISWKNIIKAKSNEVLQLCWDFEVSNPLHINTGVPISMLVQQPKTTTRESVTALRSRLSSPCIRKAWVQSQMGMYVLNQSNKLRRYHSREALQMPHPITVDILDAQIPVINIHKWDRMTKPAKLGPIRIPK